MERVFIFDATLAGEKDTFSFKEKLEAARLLDNLGVDVIEFAPITDLRADTLLVRTVLSFINKSRVSVGVSDDEQLSAAITALGDHKNAIIRITLPVSDVCMEYTCHKKPAKMAEYIENLVKSAVASGHDVEFCALDSTRADGEFLRSVLASVEKAGTKFITLCEDTGDMLPDEFADFVKEYSAGCTLGVKCSNAHGLALAQSILAAKSGAKYIKTSAVGECAALGEICKIISLSGAKYGLETAADVSSIERISSQIGRMGKDSPDASFTATFTDGEQILLNKNDARETVISAAEKLGYDLSDDDKISVYDEFLRVAEHKTVGAKELDAIIASAAMQVPASYKLDSFLINTGNIISSSAQVTLIRDGKMMQGISIGDGPIDAAFLAIEKIIGVRYELDDFQIKSVTEGKEAMGLAIVKLRYRGKLYSGNGISTDIIGASVRAYINAVNKIIYEEA